MGFGEYLIKLRNSRGYSQRQLAFKAELSNTEISRLENNERDPSLQTIKKLSKALGILDEDLMRAAGYLDNTNQQNIDDSIEKQFPRISRVLRRNGKRITPEDEKLIAKIIEAAVEDKD